MKPTGTTTVLAALGVLNDGAPWHRILKSVVDHREVERAERSRCRLSVLTSALRGSRVVFVAAWAGVTRGALLTRCATGTAGDQPTSGSSRAASPIPGVALFRKLRAVAHDDTAPDGRGPRTLPSLTPLGPTRFTSSPRDAVHRGELVGVWACASSRRSARPSVGHRRHRGTRHCCWGGHARWRRERGRPAELDGGRLRTPFDPDGGLLGDLSPPWLSIGWIVGPDGSVLNKHVGPAEARQLAHSIAAPQRSDESHGEEPIPLRP